MTFWEFPSQVGKLNLGEVGRGSETMDERKSEETEWTVPSTRRMA